MTNNTSNQLNDKSVLSHNIKYLRKVHKMNQEQLASKLGIKRSNIAAYESKNVEPRLRVILEISRLFDISVKALIDKKLDEGAEYQRFDTEVFKSSSNMHTLDIDDNTDVEKFVDKSVKIRKVLEGFKAFYSFKKNALQNITPEQEKLTYDIDNFIQLMEHLLAYNETVIKAITNSQKAAAQ